MADDSGIDIYLDGERQSVRTGATLHDILPDLDPAFAVCVLHPVEEEAQETRQLRLISTVGEMVLEITDPRWYSLVEDAVAGAADGLGLRWQDRQAAAFGPFETDISPARMPHQYARGDVILGCGGYDPSRSHLVFSRRRHTADHGAGPEGGVIGRVVRGRAQIDRFAPGDRITEAERVIAWSGAIRSYTTTDRSTALEEGMQVFSRIRAAAEGYSPQEIDTEVAESVEFFLIALEEGRFTVQRASSTHIQDSRMMGFPVPPERVRPRFEGTVTFRTEGKTHGCLYIYTTDTPSTFSHTLVGRVLAGIELAATAREGDLLRVETSPRRLDLVGMRIGDAREAAAERDIRITESDGTGDDRVVVECDPATTLEILARSEVTVTTAPESEVITVRLDDEHAPETCRFFRTITGLHLHRLGRIPFTFQFEDLYLFQPKLEGGVHVRPENTPEGEVPAGTLAVTNDSRKSTGMVGVRLAPSSEFGPTAEPFQGTNCIGEVLDPEKMEQLEEGGWVYITEERA